jgi:DNA-binding CsgD family transcriptional regulator
MKAITHQNLLPAGLVDSKSVEIFSYKNEAYALFNGHTISFWSLPANIIEYLRREMLSKKNLVKFLKIDKIHDENERLEQYVIKTYGRFDNIPDFDGKISHDELNFDESCACFNLTPREKEVIGLIAMGYLRKEIADRLKISIFTVNAHCDNIYKKIHGYNNVHAARFVMERNLDRVLS